MITFTKTETKTQEIKCTVMIAHQKGAVCQYLQATEEDLKAAGYVPAVTSPNRTISQAERIADLEKELAEYKDRLVNRSLVAQAKQIDEQAREIARLRSLLSTVKNAVHNA